MASLIYYKVEKVEFTKAFQRELEVSEAEIIFKKLLRHFKLRPVGLKWTSGRNHPSCSSWRIVLNVDYNNYGTLCHEIAHLYQFQYPKYRGNGTFHNKKHKRVMARMVRYCEKRNWFEDELKRRLAFKEPKPEPTKEELKLKTIVRLENNCKRYQTKIKLYSNKLEKAQKQIVKLKRQQYK